MTTERKADSKTSHPIPLVFSRLVEQWEKKIDILIPLVFSRLVEQWEKKIDILFEAFLAGDDSELELLQLRLQKQREADRAVMNAFRNTLAKKEENTLTLQERNLLALLNIANNEISAAEHCLLRIARSDNPLAFHLLGGLYDLKSEWEQAKRHYERAKFAGYKLTLNSLGIAHFRGHKNYDRHERLGMMYLTQADERGSITAAMNLAQIFADDAEIVFHEIVFQKMHKSIERGHPQLLPLSAWSFITGDAVKQDLDLGMSLLNLAVEYSIEFQSVAKFRAFWSTPLVQLLDEFDHAHPTYDSVNHSPLHNLVARFNTRATESDIRDVHQRIKQLEAKKLAGDDLSPKERTHLGLFYIMTKNHEKAAAEFKEVDTPDARFFLTQIRHKTDKTIKEESIIDEYKKIVIDDTARSHPGTWFELGNLFLKKKQEATETAIYYLRLAADSGHAGACCTLAGIYEADNDKITRPDEIPALYTCAIEQGHVAALSCYARYSQFKDYIGIIYYLEAAQFNDQLACYALGKLFLSLGTMHCREEAGRLLALCTQGKNRALIVDAHLLLASYDYCSPLEVIPAGVNRHQNAALHYRKAIEHGSQKAAEKLTRLVEDFPDSSMIVYHAAIAFKSNKLITALNKFAAENPRKFIALFDTFDNWDTVKPLLTDPVAEKIKWKLVARQVSLRSGLKKKQTPLNKGLIEHISSFMYPAAGHKGPVDPADKKDDANPADEKNPANSAGVTHAIAHKSGLISDIIAKKRIIESCIEKILGSDAKREDSSDTPEVMLLDTLQSLPAAVMTESNYLSEIIRVKRSKFFEKWIPHPSTLPSSEQVVLGLLYFVPCARRFSYIPALNSLGSECQNDLYLNLDAKEAKNNLSRTEYDQLKILRKHMHAPNNFTELQYHLNQVAEKKDDRAFNLIKESSLYEINRLIKLICQGDRDAIERLFGLLRSLPLKLALRPGLVDELKQKYMTSFQHKSLLTTDEKLQLALFNLALGTPEQKQQADVDLTELSKTDHRAMKLLNVFDTIEIERLESEVRNYTPGADIAFELRLNRLASTNNGKFIIEDKVVKTVSRIEGNSKNIVGLYYKALGGVSGHDKAVSFFEHAIRDNREDPYAHYHLATLYQTYPESDTHRHEAITLFKQAASLNHPAARDQLNKWMKCNQDKIKQIMDLILADKHENDYRNVQHLIKEIIFIDNFAAHAFLDQMRAELHRNSPLSPQAHMVLGMLAEGEENPDAVAHFKEAAEQKYPSANEFCFDAHISTIKKMEADVLKGVPEADIQLHLQLIQFVESSPNNARIWIKEKCADLEKKSDHSLPSAQFLLGILYFAGAATREEYQHAGMQFRKWADQHETDHRGWYFLAQYHKSGKGVPYSRSLVIAYLRKAIEHQHPLAKELEKEVNLLAPPRQAAMYGSSSSAGASQGDSKQQQQKSVVIPSAS